MTKPGAAATTQPTFPSRSKHHGRQVEQIEGAAAARAWRPRPGRDRRHAAHARDHPQRLRALRLRAGGDAGDRIYRRARQVPAGPGPPERGRVLVPGRRRAVAVAALRSHRAARALRGGEFRRAAQALSQLSRRLRVPQREARPRPLPPVHAVRRRHRRARRPRRRCRDVHDGRRHDGSARHPARQLRGEGQQPQGARRRAGSDWPRRRGECRQASHGHARHRQVGSVGSRRRVVVDDQWPA